MVPDFRLGLPALGDVLHEADKRSDVALGIVDGHDRGTDPDEAAVPASHPDLMVGDTAPGLQGHSDEFVLRGVRVVAAEVAGGAQHCLGAVEPHHAGQAGIGQAADALWCGLENADGQRVDDAAQIGLVCGQGGARGFQFPHHGVDPVGQHAQFVGAGHVHLAREGAWRGEGIHLAAQVRKPGQHPALHEQDDKSEQEQSAHGQDQAHPVHHGLALEHDGSRLAHDHAQGRSAVDVGQHGPAGHSGVAAGGHGHLVHRAGLTGRVGQVLRQGLAGRREGHVEAGPGGDVRDQARRQPSAHDQGATGRPASLAVQDGAAGGQ